MSLRRISFSSTSRRFALRSIGERSKCGGITVRCLNVHLPFFTSCDGGTTISSKCPTADDTAYSSLSKYSFLRDMPPSARAISAATEGFSAMMSFLLMAPKGRRGYPQSLRRDNQCGIAGSKRLVLTLVQASGKRGDTALHLELQQLRTDLLRRESDARAQRVDVDGIESHLLEQFRGNFICRRRGRNGRRPWRCGLVRHC